ncbi:MAG TPA: ABC transporter permease [Clostridia bacterium]|nr:ABC transporter permease [Clostridia bacterium]
MKQFISHAKILGKLTLKDPASLFWTIIYPILLVTMMAVGFSGIKTDLEPISVAVEVGHPYQQIFSTISILAPSVMDADNASQALSENRVEGFYRADGTLLVGENNSNATILSGIGTDVKRAQTASRLGHLPDYAHSFVVSGDQKSDMLVSILCVTIGMLSLYSYFAGITMTENMQANLSPLAARLSVTPISRFSYLTAGTGINTVLTFLESLALLLYLKFVWKADFLVDAPRSLLLLFVAGLFGITLGLFVGSSNRWPAKVKVPLGISVTLTLGAMGGMMGSGLRVFIDKAVPWLNDYNPVSVIGRLLYRLNVLDTRKGYTQGVITLACGAVFLFVASLFFMRKRRFKSL